MSIFFLTLDKEPDLEKKETPGFFLWIKSGGKRGAKWEAYRKKGLCWSREAWDDLSSDRTTYVREVVARTGAQKMLLARVDCDEAIKWALELGVTRFQGHFIDKLIKAMTAKGGI